MQYSPKECDICSQTIGIGVLQNCDHNNICLSCFIRFRDNYKSDLCYFCRKSTETGSEPIAVMDTSLDYATARGKNPQFNTIFRIYIDDRRILAALDNIYHFICPDCKCEIPTIDSFIAHMKTHSKRVCSICYHTRRFTPQTVPIFDQWLYEKHLDRHPKCVCCRRVFFDHATIAEHMKVDHYRCEICVKYGNVLWFNKYEDFIKHNESTHYVCHYPSCGSENLIAFDTKAELIQHLKKVHGEKYDSRLPLDDFSPSVKVEQGREEREQREKRKFLNDNFSRKLKECFGGKSDVIVQLKECAADFLNNIILCKEFIDKVHEISGDNAKLIIFHLIATIPDIQKRSEIVRVYSGISQTNMPRSVSAPSMTANEEPPTPPTPSQPQNSPINLEGNQNATSQRPPQKTDGRKRPKKYVITDF